MSHLRPLRRPCSFSAAAVTVAVLGLSVPAPALADPSEGRSSRVDVGAARNRVDLPVGEVRRLLDQIERGTATSASTNAPAYRRPAPGTVPAKASGPGELLGTAVGLTAAAALLSGSALISSRRRSLAHPAP